MVVILAFGMKFLLYCSLSLVVRACFSRNPQNAKNALRFIRLVGQTAQSIHFFRKGDHVQSQTNGGLLVRHVASDEFLS